jgi:hypothetical protein
MKTSIIWPVIALAGLTACIWVLMYVRRISEIRESKINPQSLATSENASARLKNVSAADNFSNLLEIPVLFYTVCVIFFITGEVAQFQLVLAWIYVALRFAHSLIHVTYNRVVHRWAVYVSSTIVLFMMWGSLVKVLLQQNAA